LLEVSKAKSSNQIYDSLLKFNNKLTQLYPKVLIFLKDNPCLIYTKCHNFKINTYLKSLKNLESNNLYNRQILKFQNIKIRQVQSLIYKQNFNFSFKITRYTLQCQLNVPNNKSCIEGNCENGYGKLIWNSSCKTYNGSFKNGKFHGKGTIKDTKSIESTYFINGIRNGKFIYKFNSKQIISGTYKNGNIHGKLIYQGNLYTAIYYYRKGLKNGKSIEKYRTKKIYSQFKNDKIFGTSTIIYNLGHKYIGKIKNGFPHGKGKMILKSGKVLNGKWINGKFVKK